ncbi:transcription termination factor, mitochondrial-like isoform X2 [Ischnura elegans]|nr:transcription termination factor, mitochondrial-like isoform X2 [Ischnura elegans]
MGIKNNDIAAPLLRFPTERLKKTSVWCQAEGDKGKNKLSYVSDRLECDPADVALAVSVHDFLLSVPFERMVEILDLLLGEGVPPAKILKDMWVFRYRTEKVLKRIQMARNGKVAQFKPWMVRCTEKILNDTIRVQAERREVYGPHNNSKVEYISSRLKLSREETEMILRRQPTLRVTGAAKLCNFLDFLYGKEGETERSPNFDPISVWSLSKILCHSLGTLKERHERLKALGYEAKHPIVLYQSKRKFEEFVRELKKAAAENSKQFEVYNSKVRKINASKNVNR